MPRPCGALWCSAALCTLNAVSACDADTERPVTIHFAATVHNEPFACGRTFAGLGLSQATIEPLDFRMYVHDVALVTAAGERVLLNLDQDERWQRDSLALLDFEDGRGSCGTGNADLRMEVRGTVPDGQYTGVEFTLGVPEELNHLDAATSPAPLNVPGLWWSWAGGYKFVRLDVKTESNPAFYFHLGATSCEGTPTTGFSCSFANLKTVRLDGFDPDQNVIQIELAELYAGSDLNALPDTSVDSVSGCMAFGGDPECPDMFSRLGMQFESNDLGGGQTVFGVR